MKENIFNRYAYRFFKIPEGWTMVSPANDNRCSHIAGQIRLSVSFKIYVQQTMTHYKVTEIYIENKKGKISAKIYS